MKVLFYFFLVTAHAQGKALGREILQGTWKNISQKSDTVFSKKPLWDAWSLEEKDRKAYELLDPQHDETTWIYPETFEGLGLFSWSSESLFQEVSTSLGRALLWDRWLHPTHHRDILEKRQKDIQIFLKSDLSKHKKRLKDLALHEQAFCLALAPEMADWVQAALEPFFWKKPFLSLNSSLSGHRLSWLHVYGMPVLGCLLPAFMVYCAVKISSETRETKKNNHPYLYPIYVNGSYMGVASLLTGVFSQARQKEALLYMKRLVTSSVVFMKHTRDLLKDYPSLGSLPSNCTDFMKKIMELNLSRTPEVLYAFWLLRTEGALLKPLWNYLAHYDLNVALASTVNQHGFCFPSYISSEEPYFEGSHLWYPGVSSEKIVPLSLDITSLHLPFHRVITGPNASGKSMFLRILISNILWSQTVAIAPAQKLRLSPFAAMGGVFTVQDDPVKGYSTFHRRVHEARIIFQKISQLRPAFFVFDELISGSSEEGCKNTSMDFTTKLWKQKNLISLITTHDKYLASMAPSGSTYYFSLLEPYTLKKGISEESSWEDIRKKEAWD